MKIKEILEGKKTELYTAKESSSLCEAMATMLDKHVSALLVMNGSELEGIISEKDVMKICHISSKGPAELKVKDFMTPKDKLITCGTNDTIESLMVLMTEKRIRHIPVIANGSVEGVVSIGDVIKNLLDAAKKDNKLLMDYISGTYPH
ncbi:MAG TPA: CBS domain-containing protein [Clostridiales bacterium]|nr:CBS domain-containing protein [Clostridiales bacterium]